MSLENGTVSKEVTHRIVDVIPVACEQTAVAHEHRLPLSSGSARKRRSIVLTYLFALHVLKSLTADEVTVVEVGEVNGGSGVADSTDYGVSGQKARARAPAAAEAPRTGSTRASARHESYRRAHPRSEHHWRRWRDQQQERRCRRHRLRGQGDSGGSGDSSDGFNPKGIGEHIVCVATVGADCEVDGMSGVADHDAYGMSDVDEGEGSNGSGIVVGMLDTNSLGTKHVGAHTVGENTVGAVVEINSRSSISDNDGYDMTGTGEDISSIVASGFGPVSDGIPDIFEGGRDSDDKDSSDGVHGGVDDGIGVCIAKASAAAKHGAERSAAPNARER